MNANQYKKYAKQLERYKNKPRITYLLIVAHIFLLLALYNLIVIPLPILQSHAIFVLIAAARQTISREKRYRGTYRFYLTLLLP